MNAKKGIGMLKLSSLCGGVVALAALLGAPGAASAQEAKALTINGYTNFEWEYMVDEAGEGDANGSFDADMFDLVLGYQVAPQVRVAADLTWEHGPASEESYGNVAVEYAFVEYIWSPRLRVRFGKMLTPWGYYNELHTAKHVLLGIKYASANEKPSRLVDNAHNPYTRFAAGVAVLGAVPAGDGELDYTLMISNGQQDELNPFEEDGSTAKAVNARVRWSPEIDKQIAASFYFDDIDGEEQTSVLSGGLTARMVFDEVGFEAEAVVARHDLTAAPTQVQVSGYFMPWYKIGESGFTPYLVFGIVDPDLDSDEDLGVQVGPALNYVAPGGLIFKIELNHFVGKGARYEIPGSGFTEIKTAVSYGF